MVRHVDSDAKDFVGPLRIADRPIVSVLVSLESN
jgi:hypothetical protein